MTTTRRWRSAGVIHERARQLRHDLTPAERRLWHHLRRGTRWRSGLVLVSD